MFLCFVETSIWCAWSLCQLPNKSKTKQEKMWNGGRLGGVISLQSFLAAITLFHFQRMWHVYYQLSTLVYLTATVHVSLPGQVDYCKHTTLYFLTGREMITVLCSLCLMLCCFFLGKKQKFKTSVEKIHVSFFVFALLLHLIPISLLVFLLSWPQTESFSVSHVPWGCGYALQSQTYGAL